MTNIEVQPKIPLFSFNEKNQRLAEPRTCKVCDKVFQPLFKKRWQVYCSRECFKEHSETYICSTCGKSFRARHFGSNLRKNRYCSDSCRSRAWEKAHPDKVWKPSEDKKEEYRKTYFTIHPEKKVEFIKIKLSRRKKLWGSAYPDEGIVNRKEISRKAEKFVAKTVLVKEGFTSIILTSDISLNFPFDVLAKKGDKVVFVEVTLGYIKKIKFQNNWPLVNFFEAQYLVCFVKPDYSFYYLKEIPANSHYISCWSKFKNHLKQQGIEMKN